MNKKIRMMLAVFAISTLCVRAHADDSESGEQPTETKSTIHGMSHSLALHAFLMQKMTEARNNKDSDSAPEESAAASEASPSSEKEESGTQPGIYAPKMTCTNSGVFSNCSGDDGGMTTCTNAGVFTNCNSSNGVSSTCTNSGVFSNCTSSNGENSTCTHSGVFTNCTDSDGETRTCTTTGVFTNCTP